MKRAERCHNKSIDDHTTGEIDRLVDAIKRLHTMP
jgi:hypothetical protein